MTITRNDVENVAALARLGLTEDEKERMGGQLWGILEDKAVLQEGGVSQGAASSSVLPVHNVVAADQPRPSDPTQALLANAPAAEENYLRVHAVLDEGN